MPVRLQLPKLTFLSRIPLSDTRKYILIGVGVLLLTVIILFSFSYAKYARLTDQKLAEGPIPDTSVLFSAPDTVGVGDPGSVHQFALRLRDSGYGEDARGNQVGWYHVRPDAIEIFPGAESYTGSEPGVLRFGDGKITKIIALSDNSPRTEYTLEPQVLSSLFDKTREKRRIVRFEDVPPLLVHAVISAEDKRFFQHSGFDPMRITKAFFVDIKERRNAQGASTLTQQVARMFWLDNEKTISRKYAELLITLHLERKLTKEKIFEYYANQVPLGRRGSFAIRGFGEASQVYFGKDLRQLTLDEAATLAGLIQNPSRRNPVRWPDRARTRRNVILKLMLDNGYISKGQYEAALPLSVTTTKAGAQSADAPYFVDLVNERLGDQFQDRDFLASGSRVYTTLDSELQRDAIAAVATGMQNVDTTLAKRNKKSQKKEEAQVALICLDPHTGEVKALVGGRSYAASQYNHATAKRPAGSVFKPFVYAAAFNSGLSDHPGPITASSIFPDQPQTFMYNGKAYSPNDYHKSAWQGEVTVRRAFADSLNVPAVEVAEATGYENVSDLAHQAGLTSTLPTPAMALGSYDATPMDMAAAYTIFGNNGVFVKPRMIARITDKKGQDEWSSHPETRNVLDPRVNYLIVNLMEEVIRSGTGGRVRGYGFNLPAAGKTGTHHDAWFAGFTSKLLCIVWVGLDDYQDLKMDGAYAALPVWTEFMKHASKHLAYRDATEFQVPEGVVTSLIDPLSGELATPNCPTMQAEYYLPGTQPTVWCHLHQNGSTQVAGWESGVPGQSGMPNTAIVPPKESQSPSQQYNQPGAPVQPGTPNQPANNATAANLPPDPNAPQQQRPTGKKRGFFDKLKGIFK